MELFLETSVMMLVLLGMGGTAIAMLPWSVQDIDNVHNSFVSFFRRGK